MLVVIATVKATLGAVLAADMFRIATTVAENPNYLNVALNFATLLVIVAGLFMAPRALRAKRLEALLAEKDKISVTHQQLAEAKEAEAQAAREKSAELGAALDEARSEAAAWQARYQEQSQYTAAPALEAIRELMEQNSVESERRHKETLLVLRSLRALIPGERDQLSDSPA